MSTAGHEARIEAGLKLHLKEECGIEATSAHLGMSEVERGAFQGCDSCGSGADPDRVFTPITYRVPEKAWEVTVEILGTSLDFLPRLLGYIERAFVNSASTA